MALQGGNKIDSPSVATSSSDNNRGGSADGGKTGDVKGGNIDVSSKTVGGDAATGKASGGEGGKGGAASASVSVNAGAGAGAANNGSAASQGARGRG